MVKSELLQKLCNRHPNLLRKDVEKILNSKNKIKTQNENTHILTQQTKTR